MGDRDRTELSDYVTAEPFDATYYREGRFADAYTPEQYDFVADALDTEVTDALGYSATGQQPSDA